MKNKLTAIILSLLTVAFIVGIYVTYQIISKIIIPLVLIFLLFFGIWYYYVRNRSKNKD